MYIARTLIAFLALVAASVVAPAQDGSSDRWLDRFSFKESPADSTGVCTGEIGALPSFSVAPSRTGMQFVRISLPFPPAALPKGFGLDAISGDVRLPADLRVLGLHPGLPQSVRKAIVSFPFTFESLAPVKFSLILSSQKQKTTPASDAQAQHTLSFNDATFIIASDRIEYSSASMNWTATPIAPSLEAGGISTLEIVESSANYLWVRLLCPNPQWPRILELRADATGTIALRAHVQRLAKGDDYAPNLGWEIVRPGFGASPPQTFSSEQRYSLSSTTGDYTIDLPDAHLLLRGHIETREVDGGAKITYLRCTEADRVPMQESAWRTSTIAMRPTAIAPLNPLLEPAHRFELLSRHQAPELDLSMWPGLDQLREYHRNAVVRAALLGDDYGNITSFSDGAPASYYGMNRLNHAPAIFEDHFRSGDSQLRETAVQWCSNMYDLSLWWGDSPDFGGTRYNAAVAAGQKEHEGDTSFLWRTNGTSHFCTKGIDAFFLAYEETGDPRMLTALHAQIAYAKQFIRVDQGECRNIGDVSDFMRLYRFTGLAEYREEALRLFRELRTKLGDDNLFSQGGQPIVKDGPFIDDDQRGYNAPFAKPYIIGYALAGLPNLLEVAPDEPRLRDVVRAVADFLAESIDPVGGWRYPHPNSSGMILSQALEHAAQITNAARVLEARGENIDTLLDAIEKVLQARVTGFQRSGTILAGLSGWETSTGALRDGKTIYDFYKKPEDRNPARDYTEGSIGIGSAPPDGLVYFDEVLSFYLAHRPAERLFHANTALSQVLARVPDARLKLSPAETGGSFIRIEHPSDPNVNVTLWGPEWASVPLLGYSQEELGGMKLDWKRDDKTGAVSYSIDRPEATFTAEFIPHVNYVECLYTAWPEPEATITSGLAVGPCQQMKGSIFDGEEADIMSRMHFLSNGAWTTLAACANGNARNIQFVTGGPSPNVEGDMVASGWKTIHDPRPDVPLSACVSKDGAWIAATAAENGTSICNNANASHRCMHSHGSVPMRRDGPSTLRVYAYLMRGTLDDLAQRYHQDAARWKTTPAAPGPLAAQTAAYGVRDMLPTFNDARIARMNFDTSWRASSLPFTQWREAARKSYLASLGSRPPLAAFNATDIATEDRGSYVAHKIAINISADERIKAYLLVPKAEGPHPAIVALHDHGAHFAIGKEKVVKPFGESEERLADAVDWTNKYYSARFIGDALAERGYVVFATDALFWGDRGRFGGVEYEDQQALGANMLQLGLSWAGKIVWDDLRSAEFVQSLPNVDPDRIGCLGLSMGSHRTWSLNAATDIVKCGAAICWMGDTPTLASPKNNQTRGQSAFSMLVPNLRNHLDYPDVASIAAPKPMLFFNGTEDTLFPVPGVDASYAKLREVWTAQNAADSLLTKLWPVPHEFNAAMQDEAFTWLDVHLKR